MSSDAIPSRMLRRLIHSFGATEFQSAVRRNRLTQMVGGTTKGWSSMFAWFQRLLPKTGGFFELFEAHAEALIAAADALTTMHRYPPALARVAFDEAVRWESPVQTFFRTATTDVRVGDVVIPEGHKILMFLAAANRDPRHDRVRMREWLRRADWADPALRGAHSCLRMPRWTARAR